jgi:hypothetical protein
LTIDKKLATYGLERFAYCYGLTLQNDNMMYAIVMSFYPWYYVFDLNNYYSAYYLVWFDFDSLTWPPTFNVVQLTEFWASLYIEEIIDAKIIDNNNFFYVGYTT